MNIGSIEIGKRTLVIAEIGNNHEGDFNIAKLLVERAAEVGVDAVKFQTIRAETFVARAEERRFQQIKRFELSDNQFRELARLAQSKGLVFLSTPFDFDSVDMLDEVVPAFKVASGDLNWHPFLDYITRKGKPILLSTGMSRVEEIAGALDTIASACSEPLSEKVILLHCVSSYPVPISEANLFSIPFLRERFRVQIGYSDHTLGILACQTAVALGACVIEKHFTYRKENQAFRDHVLSADPAEMKELVANIKLVEASLGEHDKRIMECEHHNRVEMRRSLASRKRLSKGDIITQEAIIFLRPATGISPERLPLVIGRKVIRDIPEGTIIRDEDIE